MAREIYGSATEALLVQRRRERRIKRAIILAHEESALATLRKVARSVKPDIGEYKAGLTVVKLRHKKETRLEARAPHSGVLELGARPFWAPIAPLEAWARRKAADIGIVDLAAGKRFRGQASLTGAEGSAARSFAYAVQHKIAERGLPARYPMRNALPFARRVIKRAFLRHLRQIVAKKASRGMRRGRLR